MSGTLKTLAAMLLVAAVGQGAVSPSFRFAYQNPEEVAGIAQFYKGPDSAFIYNWGYQFPGRAHSESKAYDGTVQGSYAFVDAHGDVQQATYQARPGVGFNVDQKVVAKGTPGVVPVVAPAAEVYPQQFSAPFGGDDVNQFRQNVFSNNVGVPEVGLDSGSEQAIQRASPTLLAAVRSGFLKPLHGVGNELVFRVADNLVDQAQGSVSALATILDADTVAARHDQQIHRGAASFYSAPQPGPSAERAVLETAEVEPGRPGYIVRVPYIF